MFKASLKKNFFFNCLVFIDVWRRVGSFNANQRPVCSLTVFDTDIDCGSISKLRIRASQNIYGQEPSRKNRAIQNTTDSALSSLKRDYSSLLSCFVSVSLISTSKFSASFARWKRVDFIYILQFCILTFLLSIVGIWYRRVEWSLCFIVSRFAI